MNEKVIGALVKKQFEAWKVKPWFLPSIFGSVLLFLIFSILFHGMLISGLFSFLTFTPDSDDYFTAKQSTKERWAGQFDPTRIPEEMSWVEYRNFSAAMLNWLENKIIPDMIRATELGDKTEVLSISDIVVMFQNESRKLYKTVERPIYHGSDPVVINYCGYLPSQKIACDRGAITSVEWLSYQLKPISSISNGNTRRMLLNQLVDDSKWSIEAKIRDAQEFEDRAKRSWGVKDL